MLLLLFQIKSKTKTRDIRTNNLNNKYLEESGNGARLAGQPDQALHLAWDRKPASAAATKLKREQQKKKRPRPSVVPYDMHEERGTKRKQEATERVRATFLQGVDEADDEATRREVMGLSPSLRARVSRSTGASPKQFLLGEEIYM